jgi:hypothetical protein
MSMKKQVKIPFPVWRGDSANTAKIRKVYLSNCENEQFDSAGFYDELFAMLDDEGVIYEDEYVIAWCEAVLSKSRFLRFF